MLLAARGPPLLLRLQANPCLLWQELPFVLSRVRLLLRLPSYRPLHHNLHPHHHTFPCSCKLWSLVAYHLGLLIVGEATADRQHPYHLQRFVALPNRPWQLTEILHHRLRVHQPHQPSGQQPLASYHRVPSFMPHHRQSRARALLRLPYRLHPCHLLLGRPFLTFDHPRHTAVTLIGHNLQ